MAKMKLGLLGKSLQHSFSPTYFAAKFKAEGLSHYQYKALEMNDFNADTLHQMVLSEKLNGFNVTIPYKEKILPSISSLTEDAKAIGAVNTVLVDWQSDNSYTLKGYNTDWKGFLKAIRPFLTVHHQQALILGTGGAAKAIAYALKSLGIDYFFASRNKNGLGANVLNYNELNQFALSQFKLMINTTPLGTYPITDACPDIPYQYIGNEHLICDLVYNPSETKYLELAKIKGAAVMNGLSMLQFQADESWEIWNNKKGHSD
jgi:shikimate dehydrogenase